MAISYKLLTSKYQWPKKKKKKKKKKKEKIGREVSLWNWQDVKIQEFDII